LNNFVKRVNDKKSELTLSKVKDIVTFKMSIINNKIDINTRNTIDKCDIKVESFTYMYDNIFKNKDSFIKKVDNLILDNIDTENIILVDKLENLKSLIDKFYMKNLIF
jgi:hypothetical protein